MNNFRRLRKLGIGSYRELIVIVFVFFLILVLWMAPNFLNNYVINMLTLVFIVAALNQSFNILSGFTGPMSLGHAAFFGIGAYTSTLLLINLRITPWVGMVIGGSLAALMGLCIGYIAFRYGIQGSYFALLTIALADALKIIDSNVKFTGGASGLLLPTIRESSWLAFQFKTVVPYYYIALGFMLVITVIVAIGSKSPLGLFLTAIRENEDAAKALGINVFKYKLIAIAISAFFTGICGTFHAQYIRYIDPPTMFGFDVSIQAMLSAVMGGLGTVIGPVIGSFVLTPLSQIVEQLIGAYSGLQTVLYGALLIIVMLVAPKGFWPVVKTQVLLPLFDRFFPGTDDLDSFSRQPPDDFYHTEVEND